MGITKKAFAVILIVHTLLFSGCSFSSPKLNLHGIALSDVKATSSSAYFLSRNGVLYCSGADSDAASYALYKNKHEGIIAENVKSFNEMPGGGYYIDYDNNLYMWNELDLPLYHHIKTKHTLVAKNVKHAKFESYCMIYIDSDNTLYLAGEFNGERYSIDDPRLLGNGVVSADIDGNLVLWSEADGSIKSFGTAGDIEIKEIQSKLDKCPVHKMLLNRDDLLLLADQELWYYGNYQKLISGKTADNDSGKELKLLGKNIQDVSAAANAVAALDSKGTLLLWGKCIANDDTNVAEPIYEYYEAFPLVTDAKSVYISGSCICYIDANANSGIYHSGGWTAFYGNSTKDNYVGINREPVTWSAKK